MKDKNIRGPLKKVHVTHENAIIILVPGIVDDDWSAFSFPARVRHAIFYMCYAYRLFG